MKKTMNIAISKHIYNRAQETEMRTGSSSQNRDFFIIVVLMIVTVCISFIFFMGQSLRLDEAQSLWQTSHTPSQILYIIAQDVHVPLYHMLLHFWQVSFGNSVVVARTLSLLFFTASIPALYALARNVYGRHVAIFASIIFTASPFLNWYGSEIRMYSLFVFLTILNQYFFVKLLRKPHEGIWTGYASTVLLGVFTHYFFFFTLITQGLFFLISRKSFQANAFRNFLSIFIVTALLFAPWIYYVYSLGSADNSRPLLLPPTSINLFNTFSQFIFGFMNTTINTVLVSLWPLVVLLGFLGIRSNRKINQETIYFILSVIIPISAAFVISLFVRPLFLSRYLILVVPSLYIVIAWMFYIYPQSLRKIFKTALIFSMIGGVVFQAMAHDVPVKENYREVAEYLMGNATAEDVVIISAPFTIYPIEYYYKGNARLVTLPHWNRYVAGPIPPFDNEKLPEEVKIFKDSRRIAWVILSFDQGYETDIKSYFDNNLERLMEREFSDGLYVYAYKLRYYEPDTEEIIRNAGR